MRHGSDLSATSHATSAPMGPKKKECTSQDGTMEECEPLGQFSKQFVSNMYKYFILSCIE